MTEPITGKMNVFLPKAMAPTALRAVLSLHVESALARTGQRLVSMEYGDGYEHSPGVMCWPVVYTTGQHP